MNFILCSFALVIAFYAAIGFANYGVDDFDQVAKEYAESKAREYGRSLSWYDIYGRHQHLAERPQYSRYKINVWTDHVQYGKVDKSIEMPGYIYTKWYHNSQSVPLTAEFSREVTLKSTYSWSTSTKFSLNYQVEITIGVPQLFLGATAKLNATLDLQSSKSETVEETEMYSMKNILTIPPKKSVKAEFIVTEKEMQIPWSADVEIEGYIAMWFEPKHNNHWLWFHPITALANDKFRRAGYDRLTYRASGMFKGMRGVDAMLKTYEYDLIDPDSYKPMTTPLNVSYIKPVLMKL